MNETLHILKDGDEFVDFSAYPDDCTLTLGDESDTAYVHLTRGEAEMLAEALLAWARRDDAMAAIPSEAQSAALALDRTEHDDEVIAAACALASNKPREN